MTSVTSSMNLDHLTSTLKTFLLDIEYIPPNIDASNKEFEAAMLAEFEVRNLRSDRLKRTIHLCASLIELGYHDLDFNEKKNAALFNWYLVHVDDMAPKNPAPYCEFVQRFLRGQLQLDPVLDALVDVLLRLWDHYQPPSANSITVAVFDFFTFSCLEPELETKPLVQDARRFPLYLRDRTGIAVAYASFIFTNSRGIDIMEYIQAMPDMMFWISLVNDLLSFYKEELAGEKANYIHTRALIEKKTPQQVLTEIVGELRTSRNAILSVLSNSGPDAVRAWQAWERGYVMWHLIQDRYKLNDLAL